MKKANALHEWESLLYVRGECKYHVVTVLKYRRKIIYGCLKAGVEKILRDLCRQRGVELLEGHAIPNAKRYPR